MTITFLSLLLLLLLLACVRLYHKLSLAPLRDWNLVLVRGTVTQVYVGRGMPIILFVFFTLISCGIQVAKQRIDTYDRGKCEHNATMYPAKVLSRKRITT